MERLTSGTYDSMYAYPNTVHSQRKLSTEVLFMVLERQNISDFDLLSENIWQMESFATMQTTGKHARRTSPLELEYEHGEEA